MTQGDLFEGAVRRDEGMATVSMNNQDWMKLSLTLIPAFLAAKGDAYFTAEDIRNYLEALGAKPSHSNAWGAFTKAAAARGLIERTGTYGHTKNPSSHARETPLWRRKISVT